MFVEIGTSSKGVVDFIMNYARVFPMLLLLGSYFTFDQEDPFFQDNATFFFLAIGLMFGLITCKLIISTMAHMTFNIFHLEPLVLYFFWAKNYFDLPISNCTCLVSIIVVTSILCFLFARACIT